MLALRRLSAPLSSLRTATRPISSSALAPAQAPTPSTSTLPAANASHTHYLVTLLRSPLHLPVAAAATCNSLGLTHRLTSSLVPITQENAGFILRVKELVAVRTVAPEDLAKAASQEWRERPGEGRRGSGLMGHSETGVVRVGSERARGEERGFKVVSRA